VALLWRITSLTQYTHDPAVLAKEHAELVAEIKELEDRKKQLRDEIFAVASDSYEGKEYLLPTTTISVPHDFFASLEIPESDFIATRFPAWNVMSMTTEGDDRIFVLQKKPEYMPFAFENDDVKLLRSPSETTPELDWEAMQEYEPRLFMKIATPVIKYELNEEALKELVSSDGEVVNRLRKYAVSKSPVLRITAKIK
jgi:hypothetical protein